jgi:predicted nuclease of restriction endonuclease-like (RecB) superfamily
MDSRGRGGHHQETKGRIVGRPGSPRNALPAGYPALVEDLKRRIRAAQLKAALSVNRELVSLYWHIGRCIARSQEVQGWGKSVVDRLAADLRREFRTLEGFSPSNLWRMRAFYLAWPDADLAPPARESGAPGELAQPARELGSGGLPPEIGAIPWWHNVILVEKVGDPGARLWYARRAVEHGWSRAVLAHQIESDLFGRQGKAVTNFRATLAPPQSDLAQQVLKDPYNFEFLTLAADARERELEQGLLAHLRRFLLELGAGFAFVGEQYRLEVGGEDFHLDLLFYHLRLRSFVVVDLKMEPFKPEFAGKMNFYLSAVDSRLRGKDDHPSVGLILCREKNRLVVEYALRDTRRPIGVAVYRITQRLPRGLKGSLPTVKQLEAELGGPRRTEPSGERRDRRVRGKRRTP